MNTPTLCHCGEIAEFEVKAPMSDPEYYCKDCFIKVWQIKHHQHDRCDVCGKELDNTTGYYTYSETDQYCSFECLLKGFSFYTTKLNRS